MKIHILKSKMGGDINNSLNNIINLDLTGGEIKEKITNPENYDIGEVMILISGYVPITTSALHIKYPGKAWEKLRMNSKIFNQLKKKVEFRSIHAIDKHSWLSCAKKQLNDIQEVLV